MCAAQLTSWVLTISRMDSRSVMSSFVLVTSTFLQASTISYIVLEYAMEYYRSDRNGLFRKSLYASLMPSSSSVLYVQPNWVALLTSRSLRGVPLGRVVSQWISP